jgi:hypothetical protein
LPNETDGKGTERQPCHPAFSGFDCLCDRYPAYSTLDVRLLPEARRLLEGMGELQNASLN